MVCNIPSILWSMETREEERIYVFYVMLQRNFVKGVTVEGLIGIHGRFFCPYIKLRFLNKINSFPAKFLFPMLKSWYPMLYSWYPQWKEERGKKSRRTICTPSIFNRKTNQISGWIQ